MDTFQRRFLRQIVRNKFIRNKKLYEICQSEPWSKKIKQRKLTWFGHLQRLPEGAPAKKAFEEAQIPHKKIRGGQKKSWINSVQRDFKTVGKDFKKAIETAHNRDEYKKLVSDVMLKTTT